MKAKKLLDWAITVGVLATISAFYLSDPIVADAAALTTLALAVWRARITHSQ
jgi:hypothetical protein